MKYMIASDIHGSAYACRKLLERYRELNAGGLILLGDILYHGPRNPLPRDYAPLEVASMLNACRDQIYAVRGNCDSEVDQMVLEFPLLADYALLAFNGLRLYATHGHIYHQENLPPLPKGGILLHGHTHVPTGEHCKNATILNPGSPSLPKEGNPPTYAILEETIFRVVDFDGNTVKEIDLGESQ